MPGALSDLTAAEDRGIPFRDTTVRMITRGWCGMVRHGGIARVCVRRLSRYVWSCLGDCPGLARLAALCFLVDRVVGRTLFGGALHITGINAFFSSVVISAYCWVVVLASGPARWSVSATSATAYIWFTRSSLTSSTPWRAGISQLGAGPPRFSAGDRAVSVLWSRVSTLGCAWLSRWYFEEPFLRSERPACFRSQTGRLTRYFICRQRRAPGVRATGMV